MSRIVLIRHSVPSIERDVPSTQWRLSPEGEAAARRLAAELVDFRSECLLASPEEKARQTADLIAEQLSLPVRIDSDLREHGRSSVGFLPRADLEAGVKRLLQEPHSVVFGDESADTVFNRMDKVLARAKSDRPEGDHLVVTHGTAMTIYVARVMGIDPFAFWRSLSLPVAIVLRGKEMKVIEARSAI